MGYYRHEATSKYVLSTLDLQNDTGRRGLNLDLKLTCEGFSQITPKPSFWSVEHYG